MLVDFRKFEYLITELAGDPETENNFLDDPTGASDPNIFVATWTVFV